MLLFLLVSRIVSAVLQLLSRASREAVDILQVSTEVATLRERFRALVTAEGAGTCVLAEVISQVAAFLED